MTTPGDLHQQGAPVSFSEGSPLVVERSKVQSMPAPDYYRVQKGDTLYGIAFQYRKDIEAIKKLNRIKPPYTIYPHQILRLNAYPSLTQKNSPRSSQLEIVRRNKTETTPITEKNNVQQSTNSALANKQPQNAVSGVTKDRDKSDKSEKTTKSVSAYKRQTSPFDRKKSVTNWVWPVKGTIIEGFSSSKQGGNGLDIAGQLGTPIRAAGHGRVVYRGSGLRGYGQLVIIKHSASILSAYAHNSKILVQENEVVKPGQVIAEMGDSGTNRVKLHFEIRKKGRPVDPMTFLPRI